MASTTHIDVTWEKMGSEFTYSVWYSGSPKGPFIKHNTTRLTDDIIDRIWGLETASSAYGEYTNNTYRVDGLTKGKTYSIMVTCEDKYDSWWYCYTAYNSLSSGGGAPSARPTLDGGNVKSFQVDVNP